MNDGWARKAGTGGMQRGAAVGARTAYQQLVGDAVVAHEHVKPSVAVHVTQSDRPCVCAAAGEARRRHKAAIALLQQQLVGIVPNEHVESPVGVGIVQRERTCCCAREAHAAAGEGHLSVTSAMKCSSTR